MPTSENPTIWVFLGQTTPIYWQKKRPPGRGRKKIYLLYSMNFLPRLRIRSYPALQGVPADAYALPEEVVDGDVPHVRRAETPCGDAALAGHGAGAEDVEADRKSVV